MTVMSGEEKETGYWAQLRARKFFCPPNRNQAQAVDRTYWGSSYQAPV